MSVRSLVRPLRRAGSRLAGAGLETLVRAAALGCPSADQPAAPESIFVLRNNDIGDLLVVTPLFDALRRRFPEARIAAGVGRWSLDALRLNPHLSEVLPVNAPWFNKYQEAHGFGGRMRYLAGSPEIREVAARRFTVGIDVLGSAWGSLLMLRARIPFRLGVRGYAGGHSAVQVALPFDPAEHVGRAALRFAAALGARDLPENRPQIFLSAAETAWAEERWMAAGAVRGRTRRLAVGPGGGLAAKRWPAESFAELVRRLPELGPVSILVLGGPGEEELAAAVESAAAAAWSFPAPPGLREVFALVATSDLVVCNSSMLLHAAAAFARPAVVVLGPSFLSARRHQDQWGYPGLSRSLGREPGTRDGLATPGEALAAVRGEMGA
jgi:heptosyltransferase-2